MLLEADNYDKTIELSHAHPYSLVWGTDDGGRRAYIDGQPVETGGGLQVKLDGEWVAARLESTSFRGTLVPVIYLDIAVGVPHQDLPVRVPTRRY